MGFQQGSRLYGALIVDAVPREMRGLAMGCYSTRVSAGMMVSSIGMGELQRGGVYGPASFRTAQRRC
jgi:hypothetical protein